MEDAATSLAIQRVNHHSSTIYSILVFALTIPFAAVFSQSFPVNGLPQLESRSDTIYVGGLDLLWAQLAASVATIIIFYEVGKRVDFAGHYRQLTAFAFAGSLIGNLPGFYLYTADWVGGRSWGTGFGYIQGFGLPEPSSIIELLASTISSFLIPIAGLAIAYFSFQRGSARKHDDSPVAGSWSSLRFFLVALVITTLTLPFTEVVYRALIPPFYLGPPPEFALVPAYVGYLVYPILFLVSFYIMGRKLNTSRSGLMRFGLTTLVGALAGLFLGLILVAYVSGTPNLSNPLSTINQYDTIRFLTTNAALVAILGFTAASLGFVATHDMRYRDMIWRRRNEPNTTVRNPHHSANPKNNFS